MKTWELSNGHPIIDVEKTDSKFVLTQSNKHPSHKIFTIPIFYKTKSGKTSMVWMKTEEMEMDIESADDWIVINVNQTGFYEVYYGERLTYALVEELKQNPLALSESEKRILLKQINFDDDDAGSMLAILGFLKDENSSSVWAEVHNSIFSSMTTELSGSSVYLQYQNYLISLIKPHLDQLGFVAIENESNNDREMRDKLIEIAKNINYEEYLKFELERLKKFLETGEGDYNLCEGLKLADATIHSNITAQTRNKAGRRSHDDLRPLTCSLDSRILFNLLLLPYNEPNNLSSDEMYIILEMGDRNILLEIMLAKDSGREEVALDFILEHFDVIRDNL
jgi:ERAP1-like C-terminal domain